MEDIRTYKPLKFGTHKVRIFSDFDGTYLPASHKTLTGSGTPDELNRLNRYFSAVDEYLSANKENVELTVTTGRNHGEFHSILEAARRVGVKIPLPKSLIVKNGGDEFLKTASDSGFYTNNQAPFLKVNLQKQVALKKLTGWEGSSIKANIIAILKSYNFEIREDATTNSKRDYGDMSTLYHVDDHFDHDGSRSPWVVALRRDGDLKFYIGFPKDMLHHHKRKVAFEDIKKQLKNAIGKDATFQMEVNTKDWEYGNHPSISIWPKINGRALTKAFDIQEAVKHAELSDDFVITAGDGDNDFEMLNPAEFIKLPESLKKTVAEKGLIDKPAEFIKLVKENPFLRDQLDSLPFKGIIVKAHNRKLSPKLQQLVDAYAGQPNPKILLVGEGEVFTGVQTAIKQHKFKPLKKNVL